MSFEIAIANGKVWLYESYEVNEKSFMQQFDCIMDAKDTQRRIETCGQAKGRSPEENIRLTEIRANKDRKTAWLEKWVANKNPRYQGPPVKWKWQN